VQDGPEVGLIATFDSCSELPKPIRAQQQPALQVYLKSRSGNKSRSETTAATGMNKGINQESQWQIKPTSGPSGEGKNRVNAMNVRNQQTQVKQKQSTKGATKE